MKVLVFVSFFSRQIITENILKLEQKDTNVRQCDSIIAFSQQNGLARLLAEFDSFGLKQIHPHSFVLMLTAIMHMEVSGTLCLDTYSLV